MFEQYRRDLAREELAPYLLVTYLETCVAGLRAFGRDAEARHAAARMLDVAEHHGLNEFVLRAEALLRDEDTARRTPRVEERPPTPEIISIARVIAEMRVAAGLPD